jgi:hypothetical protein
MVAQSVAVSLRDGVLANCLQPPYLRAAARAQFASFDDDGVTCLAIAVIHRFIVLVGRFRINDSLAENC